MTFFYKIKKKNYCNSFELFYNSENIDPILLTVYPKTHPSQITLNIETYISKLSCIE